MIKQKLIAWLMPALVEKLVKEIRSNPLLSIEIERIVRRFLREQKASKEAA